MNETNCCTRRVLLLLFLSAGCTLPPLTPHARAHVHTYRSPPNTHANTYTHGVNSVLAEPTYYVHCVPISAWLSFPPPRPPPAPAYLSTVPCAPSAFFIS